MNIYILHLYYDLMNLYGEIGNIKALEKSLESQKIKVIIDNKTINDEIDFSKYDLIYIGSGTENNLSIVLDDIKKHKEALENYIENNKFIISTGNSYELFGKSINGIDALNIFNYKSIKLEKRVVGDIIVKCDFIEENIIGFLNHACKIIDNDTPMFKVINGIDDYEGFNYKNFYGTYLLGPLLVRNPNLHKYIVTKLIKSKNKKFKLKKFNFKLDEEAYKTYMNTYHKDIY